MLHERECQENKQTNHSLGENLAKDTFDKGLV
jgi:hypothetical protein